MGDNAEETKLKEQGGATGADQGTSTGQGLSTSDDGQGAGSGDQTGSATSGSDSSSGATSAQSKAEDGEQAKQGPAAADAKKAAKGGKAKNAAPAADPAGVTGTAAPEAGKKVGSAAGKNSQSTPGLEVTSIQDGFWRGDRQWRTTPTVVKLADLSEHQIEQIKGEPMLTVVEIDIPVEQEGQ